MNQDLLWRRIAANEQRVAAAGGLVRPGETYRLTQDQEKALTALDAWYAQGVRAALLEAPTGAGKTAVEFHVALREFLRRAKPVVVLAPTRDLVRQHLAYFADRLLGTPLQVAEIHGGVAPRDRDALLARVASGTLSFLIGSGLLLKDESMRRVLRDAGFIIVDDLHAFDPVVHLKPLRGVHTPGLYATATPEVVTDFLTFHDATSHTAVMVENPFQAPETRVEVLKARFGTDPVRQVLLAEEAIARHLDDQGRVFVISRTREQVPKLRQFLERRFGVLTVMLHGEMVDTAEQARRLQKFKAYKPDATRVAMMTKFRDTLPAILVGTNLVGSGLDIPDADLLVVTDADGFGPAEIEQLVGRVGRRERNSEAYLVKGTLAKPRRSRR